MKYFPPERIMELRNKLYALDDEKYIVVSSAVNNLKDPTTIIIISAIVGTFGVDRFMIDDVGMGVLKLLTGGLCGILWIYDLATIMGRTKQKNFDNFMRMFI